MDTEENDGGYCTKPDSRRKGSLDTTVAVSRKLVNSVYRESVKIKRSVTRSQDRK